MTERIQKLISAAGLMSRRAAEDAIAAGRVSVNGVTAALGRRADPETDTVLVDGKPLPLQEGKKYIMLNKPRGYVTTMSDEKGRRNVTELVKGVGCRVYPVGRLDMYSEGLLICTDDGELANRLMHPSHSFEKVYKVKVKGTVTDKSVTDLTAPMELDGYKLRPVEVKVISSGRRDRAGSVYSTLLITLHEGRNRQIRRMCENCGISVMRLKRVAIGKIELGKLESGKWRYLTEEEITYLKGGEA